MTDLKLPPWMLEKITKGECVLFLGAGASFGASGAGGEIPLSGEQLRDRLSDKFLGGQMKDKSLAVVAEFSKNESSLVAVQQEISRLFEPLYPAEFHALIADFRWHAIVTTNYDYVVERAYDENKQRLQTIGKITRDDDNFGDVISSLQQVPLLKIHGCLSTINDPNLPLILATEEYAKHRNNRHRLFSNLYDWGKERPIIFVGYDLGDPNIQQIFYEIGDSTVSRAQYVMVRPGITDLDSRYWNSRRVNPINASFEDFLLYLDKKCPANNRKLATLYSEKKSGLPLKVGANPSEILVAYLNSELLHVRVDMPSSSCTPKDFYRSADVQWNVVRDQYDIRRRVTDEILIESVLDADDSNTLSVHLLKGYAGSGKTITLMRIAWESAVEQEKSVFWLSAGGVLRHDLIEELSELTDNRIFIFVEDVVQHAREVEKLAKLSKNKSLAITIILGARTNEWNVTGPELNIETNTEYELRDLSNTEIDALIIKLDKNGCLGELENHSEEDRRSHFALSSKRQLLVALHEATTGKSFEVIVKDEYKNIQPTDAKLLYLDVCTLHRFGVGVRAGLISRVTGIGFSYFQENLLKPLEHVIRIYNDAYSKDFAYATRHPIVADIVFRTVLTDPEDRSNQIVRVVGQMNTDYQSDKRAFTQFVKGKELAELFSDRLLADRIFDAALNSGAEKSHIELQKAIFELNHPGGTIARAKKSLDLAEQNSQPYLIPFIKNTRATMLRRQALDADNVLAAAKFREDAEEILKGLCSQSRSPYPFHTLAALYLDEIDLSVKHVIDSGGVWPTSRNFENSIKKTEKTLNKALAYFPEDDHLRALEARLADKLKDTPKALDVLRAANNNNPHEEYIAIRYARLLISQSDLETAEKVLRRCVEVNPNARRAKYDLSRLLINENDLHNNTEISKLLRSAFSDGDSNYDTQFWYARHEYLFGNRTQGVSVFNSLAKVRKIPRAIGTVRDSDQSKKVFTGTVKSKYDSYCFVGIGELNSDVYVHHMEFDENVWANMKIGSTVNLHVAFNYKGAVGQNIKTGAKTRSLTKTH